MRLLIRRLSATLLVCLTVVIGLSPTAASAMSAPAAPRLQTVTHTGLNDFVIDSFEAQYDLGRDDEGRSTLTTTEHIVAHFPDFDQNRGLIRDIPNDYDGHSTKIEVLSVTDETGTPRHFSTEPYGDFLAVTVAVPEGSFVHGAQHYVITYTQRDVTRFFKDTGVDEFYWDINGTEWPQPFGTINARLTLSDELAEAFTGDASCYRGSFGSASPCEINVEGTDLSLSEADFSPFENVTIAAGFAPGTFTPAPKPFLEQVPLLLFAGFTALGGAVMFVAFTIIQSLRGRKSGRAIIAQYEPPEGLSAAVAADLMRSLKKAMTATLLDLAVRRNIRLLYDAPSGLYGAQALDGAGMLSIEQLAYDKLFSPAKRGKTLWFQPTSNQLGDAAVALRAEAKKEVRTRKLMRRVPVWQLAVIALLFILALVFPVLHAAVSGNTTLMTILLAVGGNVIVWFLLILIGGLSMLRNPSGDGVLLREHLLGLREFIRLAEADRIRMLQSASGVDVTEDRIVQVYERLLPYAVIFGQETEWQAALTSHYRQSTPEWMSGSAGTSTTMIPFTAFHSAVASSPSTRTASSGSSGGFSSSSGGSSGGGFSGGGGGGGGGRGI